MQDDIYIRNIMESGYESHHPSFTDQDLKDAIKRKSKECYSQITNTLYHLFNDHPISRGMSYYQHMLGALSYFSYSSLASLSFLIHALCPFMFESNGSYLTHQLHAKLVTDQMYPNIDKVESNENREPQCNDDDTIDVQGDCSRALIRPIINIPTSNNSYDEDNYNYYNDDGL